MRKGRGNGLRGAGLEAIVEGRRGAGIKDILKKALYCARIGEC
jgi:hypothetical protein